MRGSDGINVPRNVELIKLRWGLSYRWCDNLIRSSYDMKKDKKCTKLLEEC
jgi:hypothetical protein